MYVFYHCLTLPNASLVDLVLQTLPRTNPGEPRTLYAISAAPPAPSARDVQSFLTKSKITDTPLGVEHVEALLDMLVLDGDIERVSTHLHLMMMAQCVY